MPCYSGQKLVEEVYLGTMLYAEKYKKYQQEQDLNSKEA